MKNLKMLYIALIALVAGTFGACTTDAYEAGPQVAGPQVSFAPTNPKSIEFTGADGEGTQKLTLTRAENESEAELSVFVIAEVEKGAETLFSIPELVTFAAGETTAELVMNIQSTQLENGKAYTVKLYLDESMTTPYGYAEWQIVFTVNPWELMTDSKGNNVKGKFRGLDLLTGLYNLDASIEVDVNIYEHKTNKGVYRVENPWVESMKALFGIKTKEEAAAKGVVITDADFEIDCSDPNCVWFAMQGTGCDFGYKNTYTMSYYWFDQTQNGGQGGVPGGTLVDGIITFPVKGTLAVEPGYDDGAYYGNKNGMFRIILPGVEIADYSLAVAYDGMDVAADNKTTTAKFKFTYGDDVTGIKYMIVNGNVESNPTEALTTLFAGQDENILAVENFVKGGKEAGVRVGMERGVYTIVAAPVDKNGALREADALVNSFYFAGIGEAEAHPCEIGVITEKFSVVYPGNEDVYPDYSSFAYCIYGTDIKSGTYLVASTSAINNKLAQGATMEELILANGNPLEKLDQVNGENGWVSNAINLKPATSYTVAVLAENVYGEKAVATAVHVTDQMPYSGSLVIGDYFMSCTMGAGTEDEVTFENVFNVQPVTGSTTDFLFSTFAIEDNLNWKAVYDEAANTVTLSGEAKGLENYGPLFGSVYGTYNEAQSLYYGIFSFANESSKGNDPIVLNVDPTTKQICGLPAGAAVYVYIVQETSTGSQLLGSYNAFDDTTTIVPYTAQPSSVKSAVKSVKNVRGISFRMPQFDVNSMRAKYSKISNIKSANLANNAMKRNVSSVKPILVEGYTPVKELGLKSVKTNKVFTR